MKLLVLGAGGQVGHELGRVRLPPGWQRLALDRAGLDVIDGSAVRRVLAREHPDIVVNAAAYTAVDQAETERHVAWAVNSAAPGHIAEACAQIGAALIHYSTDYVFDGMKLAPYREDDMVRPLGIYGESKEAGERAVRSALDRHVMLRTSWIYAAHGRNFVRTILRLAGERPVLRVVADQHGAPTAAADIAAATLAIAERITAGGSEWGTFHFANAGETTWHGFAEAIVALAAPQTGKSPRVVPIRTADYPTAAQRPANSRLDCTRIGEVYGVAARSWQAALHAVLGEVFGGAR